MTTHTPEEEIKEKILWEIIEKSMLDWWVECNCKEKTVHATKIADYVMKKVKECEANYEALLSVKIHRTKTAIIKRLEGLKKNADRDDEHLTCTVCREAVTECDCNAYDEGIDTAIQEIKQMNGEEV